ncbi:GNAT family N-acetyltransferase [Aliiroseovarius sp.]|uniref:GNAT family N-acetyltransferase n=1 Tax=Aliiroseovarius sp. TaxID=1872442 RepID=UPI003BAD2E72
MSTPFIIPTLETERLMLRGPSADDLAPMMTFFGSDHATFYGGPMTEKDAWLKLASYAGQWAFRPYGWFSAYRKSDMAMVGMAGPHHPVGLPEPEMSWLLVSPDFEGQGLAREAAAAVLNHLFADLGWDSVVSYIDPKNIPSRKLAEALGATLDTNAVSPLEGCDVFRHVAKSGGTA